MWYALKKGWHWIVLSLGVVGGFLFKRSYDKAKREEGRKRVLDDLRAAKEAREEEITKKVRILEYETKDNLDKIPDDFTFADVHELRKKD